MKAKRNINGQAGSRPKSRPLKIPAAAGARSLTAEYVKNHKVKSIKNMTGGHKSIELFSLIGYNGFSPLNGSDRPGDTRRAP